MEQGYFIIMSAGSKGPIDVICYPIDNPTKPILNCQCKKYKDNKPNPTQEFRDLKIPGKKLWCTKKLRQVGFDIEEIL